MEIKTILSKYKTTFKDDLLGGLLAAIIGLPMGLAFGVQSGLGPQAGIYTAIILAIVVSFFGGTKTLISDPTGPMTVVAATVVSVGLSSYGDLENAFPLIISTFVLAGIFELLFGVFDLGKYVKFMPYPVLSGFMAGIGVIIIAVQVFPLLGHRSPQGFLNIITGINEPIANINWQSFFLGGLTIAIVYLLPLLTKKIPAILAALIIGTVVSVVFSMNVPIIGEIPKSLPTFHLSTVFKLQLADLRYIVPTALMIGALGVIDTLLTSVVADNLTRTKHDSKKTVIGQGIGNIIVGLFGGLPGAGATMGTVTNIKSGAKTPLSGLLKGVILLAIIVGITEYVQYIPMSVLAGILMTIGIGIIDYKGIKMLFKVPKQDAVVWAIVLLITVFDNLLDAVGIGFVLSAVLFIGRMTKSMRATDKTMPLPDVMHVNPLPEALADKVFVKNIEGPIFFGFVDVFKANCEKIDGVYAVILRMNQVPFLDQSGLVTLKQAFEDWQQKGIEIYITGANRFVIDSLEKVRIIPNDIAYLNIFERVDDAVNAIQKQIKLENIEVENLKEEDVLEMV